MVYIKEYVVMLITLAVFLGVVGFIFPKGALSAPLKLICGLIMLLALLSPVAKLVSGGWTIDLSLPASAPSLDSRSSDSTYKNQLIKLSGEGIIRDVEEYLLNNYNIRAKSIDARVYEDKDSVLRVDFITIELGGEYEGVYINQHTLKERYEASDLIIRRD